MCNINELELNAILYYADYLSLSDKSIPVTDTCKYFFIYNSPINSAFIVGNKPIYDENNEYFKKSKEEYLMLRGKFGDGGVMSFVNSICSLSACGTVSANNMLNYIHRYSSPRDRQFALNKYNKFIKSTKYKHTIKDDEGKPVEAECSKYVAHDEFTKNPAAKPELFRSDDDAINP